ncbi:MAG: class I SAM-dependent methyltransferase [Thermoplasmata archaeon]
MSAATEREGSTAPADGPGLDWAGWWRRWERQQAGYLPLREARFDAMFALLEVELPPSFRAVDLASGPGGLADRLLRRFPEARVEAVDFDPVLLRLGREVLGTASGRLGWIDADLRGSEWPRALGVAPVDAVLTTTALHWLSVDELGELYATLHKVVRPGGLFVNGDSMAFPGESHRLSSVAKAVSARGTGAYRARTGAESWEDWWSAFAREPRLAKEFAERSRRLPQAHGHPPDLGLDDHLRLLRVAGFREVGVIWSHYSNRVVAAVA